MNTRISQLVAFMVLSILSSTASYALTLGDLRGSAVLGQPLDVSVAIGAGDGESVSGDCLSAELLFGDVPQRAPSLRLQDPPAGALPTSLVRIRSFAAVNEPIVTMVLRATCGASTSRRYVLLSDFPATGLPTTSALPADRPAGAKTPGQRTLPPMVTDLQPLTASPGAASAQGLSAAAVAATKPKTVKTTRSAAAPTKKRAAALPTMREAAAVATTGATANDARLVLKLDSDILTTDPKELAAQAALRVSLPKLEPEGEALKQSLQLDALQIDLKAFKELANKNQATLAALQVKLSQAEAERAPMIWLYLLGGLLVAALAALAWVLRQQQTARAAWWQQVDGNGSATETIGPITDIRPAEPATQLNPTVLPPVPVVPAAAVASVASSAAVKPALPVVQEIPASDLDFDLDLLDDMPKTLAETSSEAVTRPGPLDTTFDLSSETVSDLRQQAEFFVSLGQAPRAIHLLQRYVQESIEPHPMVYLDLLTLYHSQGMKAEFREVRLEFNCLFNAVMPDFPAFHQEGRSLLDYPEQLAELVKVWPDGEAIAFLDACIFPNGVSTAHLGFDLAAFRDLLLLRSLVENIKGSEHQLRAKPFDSKPQSTLTLADPGMDNAQDGVAQATLPAQMPVTQSAWLTPQAAPTTEELELEFQIDLLNTQKAPKS